MKEFMSIDDISRLELLSDREQNSIKLYYADTIRKRNYFLPRSIVHNSHVSNVVYAALTLIYKEKIFNSIHENKYVFNKTIDHEDFIRIDDGFEEAATYAFYYSQMFLNLIQEEKLGYHIFPNKEGIKLHKDFDSLLSMFVLGGATLREISDLTNNFNNHKSLFPEEDFIPHIKALGTSFPSFSRGISLDTGLITLRVAKRTYIVLVLPMSESLSINDIQSFKGRNLLMAPNLTEKNWHSFEKMFPVMPKVSF